MAKSPLENFVHQMFHVAARIELEPLCDQQLLERYVKHRDELAYGVLVHRHRDMVWNICRRVLGQHQDTEDTFQATFMMLTYKAARIPWRESIEGWLHTLAYRVATKAKIERAQRRAREERRAQMQQESFENNPATWELDEVLDKELTRIPAKYRSPLILCYLEGLTREQAARRMNIPVSRLDRQLAEGRKQLRERLQRHGLDMQDMLGSATFIPGAMAHAVPPRLVERTLDMARSLAQANGVLETAGIPAGVATLVKGTLGVTLKMKLLLGSLLLSFVVVTAGAAKYAGIFRLPLGTQRQDEKSKATTNIVEEPKLEKTPPRVDCYGDPLPKGAMARLGTVRFRKNRRQSEFSVVFTPDSKAIGLLSVGEAPRLWDMKTGEPVRHLGDRLQGQPYASSWMPVSADGRLMAYQTGNDWRQHQEKVSGIHVRETITGKLIRDFGQTEITAGGLAISSDGKALVAMFTDMIKIKNPKNGKLEEKAERKLCMCDIATGQRQWEQKIDESDYNLLWEITFSPASKMVALGFVGTQKKSIELRDASNGQLLRTLGSQSRKLRDNFSFSLRPLGGISFSPDGHTLAAVHHTENDQEVHLWDVDTGKERWHLDKKRHNYYHASFSPDSKIVALWDCWENIYNEIGLYEVATGKKLRNCQRIEFLGNDSSANLPDDFKVLTQEVLRAWMLSSGSLTFSPDGKVLASMAWSDPLIRCWDVATGKILNLPSFGHESPVNTIAFAADSKTLVSSGENYSVHLWDSFTGHKQRTLSEESNLRSNKAVLTGNNVTTAVSADGRMVAGVRIELPPPDEKLSSMLPEQAGPALAASLRVNIFIWDTVTGHELRKITLGAMRVNQLALSPDGKFLAAWRSSRDIHIVNLWEVASGKPVVKKIEGSYPIFSPDSKYLMTHKDGVFSLWNVATGKKLSAVTGVEFEKGPKLAVTPDWQTLVCFSLDKKKQKRRLYLNSLYLDKQSKLTLGRPRYFDGQESPVHLAVSPDGKMISLSDLDSVIHLVETITGAERARFEGHSSNVRSMSFSPDSRRLASGGSDTTILIWDVSGGLLDNRGQLRSARLSDPQVQQLWDALAGTDAAKAGHAIWTLAAAPKQTVPFLATHLSPVVLKNQPSAQRIAQLVAQLDDEKYAVRQKAIAELSKMGGAAEAGIRQALEKKQSLEVSRGLKQLLGAIEDQRQGPSKEDIRYIRAIEVLERVATPEACRLLETLSQGAPGVLQTREGQAALHRLQKVVAQRAVDVR